MSVGLKTDGMTSGTVKQTNALPMCKDNSGIEIIGSILNSRKMPIEEKTYSDADRLKQWMRKRGGAL